MTFGIKVIEESDITYFSKLNDIWDFGGVPARNSGYRMAVNFIPTYRFSLNKHLNKTYDYLNDIENQFKYMYTSMELENKASITFSWEKPINLKFQSTFATSIDYFFTDKKSITEYSDTLFSEDKYKGNSIGGHIDYTFGIYPNLDKPEKF